VDQIKTGQFIASLRKEHSLTQEQLGGKLGVTNKTVSRWENGHYMPDIDQFLQMSELFSVSISELLAGERLTCVSPECIDIMIQDAVSCDRFSVPERMRFWKKKWLHEHGAGLLLLLVLVIALYVLILLYLDALRPVAAAILSVGCVIIYALINNSLMIYVEHKVFDR